jgi:hypothetical protein
VAAWLAALAGRCRGGRTTPPHTGGIASAPECGTRLTFWPEESRALGLFPDVLAPARSRLRAHPRGCYSTGLGHGDARGPADALAPALPHREHCGDDDNGETKYDEGCELGVPLVEVPRTLPHTRSDAATRRPSAGSAAAKLPRDDDGVHAGRRAQRRRSGRKFPRRSPRRSSR